MNAATMLEMAEKIITSYESKEAVDQETVIQLARGVVETFGSSAMIAVYGAPSPLEFTATPAYGISPAYVEPQYQFDVVITKCDQTRRLDAIKTFRELIHPGLQDCVDLFDTLKTEEACVKRSVNTADANELRDKLTAAGCSVELR